MTQAVNERCEHDMLDGQCVVSTCRHYDGLGALRPLRPKALIHQDPTHISRPYVDHPGAVRKRTDYKREKRAMLSPEQSPLRQRALHIAYIVADAYALGSDHLLEGRRFKELIEPRHVMFYVSRHGSVPRWSFPSIGFALGFDHTTVMSAERNVARRMVHDFEFAERVRKLVELAKAAEERRLAAPEIPDLVV
jgi:hypothetical protein